MKYMLYTGCMIPVTAPHYEISARKVCDSLKIELEPLKAPCCGNPVKVVNASEAAKMALYVLWLASERGNYVMTLCSACTSSLLHAQKKVDKKFLDQLNVDAETIRNVKVKHFIKVLYEDIGLKTIEENIKIPIDVKAAVHYGCHLHRPSSLYTEDPEYPHSLDELVEICGTHSIDYRRKSMCCGSPLMGVDFDVSLKMTSTKLQNIKNAADMLVVTCSGCAFMFDGKQKSVESITGELNIPVLFYSQVLGLALGIPPGELGFSMNRVRVDPLLEKVLP